MPQSINSNNSYRNDLNWINPDLWVAGMAVTLLDDRRNSRPVSKSVFHANRFATDLKFWCDWEWNKQGDARSYWGLQAAINPGFALRLGLSPKRYSLSLGIELALKEWRLFESNGFNSAWGQSMQAGLLFPIWRPFLLRDKREA